MIPEIGQLSLMLGLMLAIVQGVLPIVGAARGMQTWMDVARPAAQEGLGGAAKGDHP